MPITSNNVKHSSNTNTIFSKINSKNIFLNILFLFSSSFICSKQISCIGIHLFPNMKNGVHRESTASCCSIDHLFIFFWIQHFNTHINNISRGKVLAHITLLIIIYQMFKRIINHFQI